MSRHVFGPVPSRRLGRSLGVDLVPFKTCNYDCIYCQLGRTTCKTIQRKEWVPPDEVLRQLEERLATRPDYITLAGSGEPTLHSALGYLIDRIKAMTSVPVAVLTNGSLLWQREIRRELSNADLVMPSLDAGDAATFQLVNRPHEAISFDHVLGGLVAFRRSFRGQLWLEIFLLAAHNAFDAELFRVRKWVDLIKPDRVQLNTATRPPAEDYAIAVAPDRLRAIAQMFSPPAEVLSAFQAAELSPGSPAEEEDILSLVERRPCGLEDIADALALHASEVAKGLERLVAAGRIVQTIHGNQRYYRAIR